MLTNTKLLSVKRVIFHDVPKRLTNELSGEVTLSDRESVLSDSLRGLFRERIQQQLQSNAAFNVVENVEAKSPLPSLLRQLLVGERDLFVKHSQLMARHLDRCQSGRNPAGLLGLVEGKCGDAVCYCILKLERDEGIRLQTKSIDGGRTFDLEYLRDLFLTKNTRLFKSGFFVLETFEGRDMVVGKVCDQQTGTRSQKSMASFFLSDFLGCRYMDDSKVETRDFFEAAESFLQRRIKDPLLQVSIQNHLLSELVSNRTSIDPRVFARDYLPAGLKQEFLVFLREQHIGTGPFLKNTELIDLKLQRIIVKLRSGIQIQGSKKDMHEKVLIENALGENVRIEIIDKMEWYGPRI